MVAPLVSVCMSTRNRAHLLPRLFAGLAAQTLPASNVEAVVVDDGSTDSTPEVLRELCATAGFTTFVLRHESSRGPAAGRNAAWRAATGPVIAFTDDDCVPAPGWLAAGLAGMADCGRVVVGRVHPNPSQMQNDGPFARRLVVGPAERRWFATANVFYRRADLERLGGFDERFRNAACEDTDLGLRAEAAGIEVVFGDDALVFHDVLPSGVRAMVRDQRRWADLPAVVRRHPSARRELLHGGVFWRRSHAELLALVAGLVCAPSRRGALVLALPWLHAKLCRDADPDEVLRLVAALPGLFAVEAAEVLAAVRGSVRHRTLVL